MLFLKIDNWDNEFAYLKLDGQTIWSQRFAYNDGTANYCGRTTPDQLVHIDVTFPHTATSATLRVETNLNQNPNDESWAVQGVQLALFRFGGAFPPRPPSAPPSPPPPPSASPLAAGVDVRRLPLRGELLGRGLLRADWRLERHLRRRLAGRLRGRRLRLAGPSRPEWPALHVLRPARAAARASRAGLDDGGREHLPGRRASVGDESERRQHDHLRLVRSLLRRVGRVRPARLCAPPAVRPAAARGRAGPAHLSQDRLVGQ